MKERIFSLEELKLGIEGLSSNIPRVAKLHELHEELELMCLKCLAECQTYSKD